MLKDYHIHPQVIKDMANFDAFANKAVEAGITEVCITDHMPLDGTGANDRIPQGMVHKYCEDVRKIAEKYNGTLAVKCGIEIDYHPSIEEDVYKALNEGEFDYVLGSSHLHVLSEIDIFGHSKTHNGYASAMLENTLSAAKTGLFDCIAHIDMYKWIFSNPERFPLENDGFSENIHSELIEAVLNEIKAKGMFLEINPHFATSTGNISNTYPSVSIVSLAMEKGIKFNYGSDAHTPHHVGIMLEELANHPVYGRALKE